MSSLKETPRWKQFEWLITKIFHDTNPSLTTSVLNDSKIIGEFSERSRQIDILVESEDYRTIIECKYHSRPIDVKQIETF